MEMQPFEDVSPIRSTNLSAFHWGVSCWGWISSHLKWRFSQMSFGLKEKRVCWTGGKVVFLFFLKMFLKKMLRINKLASYEVSVMICLRIEFLCSNIRIPFTLHVAAKHLLQVAIVPWPIFGLTGRLLKKLVSGCNDHLSGIKFLIFLADQTMHKWQFWRHFPSKNRALS